MAEIAGAEKVAGVTNASRQPVVGAVPSAGVGAPNTLVRTKLRKKRSDAPRASSGTAGVAKRTSRRDDGGPGAAPSSGHQQPQSIYRRLARARWAAAMFLPPLLLLLHRTDRVEAETHGLLTTVHTMVVFAMFSLVSGINELLGWKSHLPAYLCVGCFSIVWGSVIVATRDLTAARFCCMLWFGVCCGSLRYHWADQHGGGHSTSAIPSGASKQKSSTSSSTPPVATPTTELSSESGVGPLSTTAAPSPPQYSSTSSNAPKRSYSSQMASADDSQHQKTQAIVDETNHNDGDPEGATLHNSSNAAAQQHQQQRHWRKWDYFCARTVEFLYDTVWRKTGLCLCASVGEVLACALFVPNSWGEIIAVSWIGYTAMLILPVVIFKSASWVSHALVLVCGSRVNTADASRLLFCYWLTTTILSLGTLVVTVLWIITSLVPYVWGLQVLMMPYAVACEWIAFESREYQATNPYKEVADVYREHIDATMQNSKEYFLH